MCPPTPSKMGVCLLQLDYEIHRIGREKAISKLAKVTLEKSLVVNAFGTPFRHGRKLLRSKKILLSSSLSLKYSHSLVSTGIAENTRTLKSWDSHLFYKMRQYLHILYRNSLISSKSPHIIPKQKTMQTLNNCDSYDWRDKLSLHMFNIEAAPPKYLRFTVG